MKREMYNEIEKYMISCMNDAAHDSQHVYRVLYFSLDISSEYDDVDMDVVIAAALLHDIGRGAQFQDPKNDHAIVGADMAYNYLLSIGWCESKANHVKSCISTHRYRNNKKATSKEAKIIFDADKLDATGALGIARTLIYLGIENEPLYSVNEHGSILSGKKDITPSFFHEYNWKLKKVYSKLYTKRARKIAQKYEEAGKIFYKSMYKQVVSAQETGLSLFNELLD